MTDTAMVPGKPEGREPARPALIDEQLADELLGKAQAQGVELLGPDGLLSQVTKAVLERALGEEMTAHLGYEKHDPAGRGSGNSRNGTTPKTLLTDAGAVGLAVPRDRAGSFDPKIVRKGQRRLEGFNERIIALYARGMTTRDIRAHLREMYDVDVSADLISRVTDGVLEELAEWQSRPLDRVFPVIFIDALMVKIRVLSLILWSAGQEDAFSEQVEAGAAEHLSFEHLKSYVESAGVIMVPRCNHGLGRWLERHGGAEGEVAGLRPARAGGDVAADLDRPGAGAEDD
jgi:hypothetical protein